VIRCPSTSVKVGCAPGWGTLFAQDQPRPLRPGGQAGHAGGLGHLRALTQPLVLDGRVPALIRDQVHDGLGALIDGNPKGNPTPSLRQAAANRCVAPAESDRASTRGEDGVAGPRPDIFRQRRQGHVQHRRMIGGGVATSIAGPQQPASHPGLFGGGGGELQPGDKGLLHGAGAVVGAGVPVWVKEPKCLRAGGGVPAASAVISSPALPAAASSPSLRRIVLTSGARSRPSTRPSAAGGTRVAPSAWGLTPQGQEHQGQQCGGQPIEPVLKPPVDVPRAAEQPGVLQRREREQQPGQRVPGTRGEDSSGEGEVVAAGSPAREHPVRSGPDVTRFRDELRSGADPETAAVTTMRTAGRSVLTAGITIVIGMLGLLVLRESLMNGVAVAAAATVAMTVLRRRQELALGSAAAIRAGGSSGSGGWR
jgi:MMPL family